MVCQPGVMSKIIRETMDDYWRVVYSKTDEGLSPLELSWKREHEAELIRLDEKFGKQFNEIFGKRN